MQPDASSTFSGIGADAFSSMFQAVGGLRNRRALIAWLGCAIVGVLCVGLLSLLGAFGTLLGALVFAIAIGTGVNAAGLLQMDQARGVPLRSLPDALVYGLMCIPKLIVLGLAFFAVTLVFFIALALIFFLCKIPFLGPVLYAVALPVAIVLTGLLITAIFACMLLSLPAIWEGATIARALTQTFAIARSRLVETLLLFVVVGVLCFAVGLIVFGVFFNGLVPVVTLSSAILFGSDSGMGNMTGMLSGMAGGGAGYVIAGFIGFGVLWSVAGALVSQVYLQGLSLVYLRVTEGLDLGAAAASLQRGLDEARQKSSELAAKARAAAAPAPSSQATTAATSAEASAAAAYGGYANPPPAYSPPPGVPPGSTSSPSMSSSTPASSMASPPAYSAPPVARPTFDFPPSPATPPVGAPKALTSAPTDIDLPGAAQPIVQMPPSLMDAPLGESVAKITQTPPTPSAAPLDLDLGFDFDLPATPAPPLAPSGVDSAPTLPLRSARDVASTSTAPTPAVPAFPSTATPAEPPASMTVTCSKCLSPASPDDVFCGVCGNRLK